MRVRVRRARSAATAPTRPGRVEDQPDPPGLAAAHRAPTHLVVGERVLHSGLEPVGFIGIERLAGQRLQLGAQLRTEFAFVGRPGSRRPRPRGGG